MTCCAVSICRNTQRSSKNPNTQFHRFPRDNTVADQWLVKCRRQDKVNLNTARICSDHFTKDDYVRDLKAELMQWKRRKILNSSAVPSINLPVANQMSESALKRKLKMDERIEKEKRAKYLESAMTTTTGDQIAKTSEFHVVDDIIAPRDETEEATFNLTLITKYKNLVKVFRVRLKQAKVKYEILKRRHQRQMSVMKQKLRQQSTNKYGEVFSKAQREAIHKSKRVNWSSSDISKALAIAVVSKKAYETIRTVWKIPLPNPRTLRRWGSRFKCQPGILTEVLTIMEAESLQLDNFAKLCILKFDEMSLTSTISWEKSTDTIMPPYQKVQVVMLSGICSNWNQPIYYNFDTNITVELLMDIIIAVEQAGYMVTSIVHDFDTQNQYLWKCLSVKINSPHFQNPYDSSRKVWTFADAPHMLKLIRNHVLDQGFVLKDKTLIDRKVLEDILAVDDAELKICPKLTQKLIDLKGAERMKVAPAAKVLSTHTASILKFIFPELPQISTFFQLIDDWFDIFNSRISKDFDKPIRSAYGMELEIQNKRLSDVEEMVNTMRCRYFAKKSKTMVERSAHIPCQIGILASINALKGLHSDMSCRHGITYIKTRRLNQDALESHFSEIRALGNTDDHPTSVSFRDREKLLLLGTKCKPPNGANVLSGEADLNYISRKLLDTAVMTNVIEPDDTILPIDNDKENDEILQVDQVTTFSELEDTCSKASLFYLAGYIAFVIKRQGGPNLSQNTNQRLTPLKEVEDSTVISFSDLWIQTLSRGGLITPNEELVRQVICCEEIFLSRYPDQKIVGKCGITNRIREEIIKADPSIDCLVAKHFVKIRLKIRIQYLNRKRKQEIKSRRNFKKSKQFSRCQ